MAPSQDDINSSIQSSNLTVSESDIDASSTNQEESSNNSSQGHKSLKELAKGNPTQLGDPVSLKAETSDHEPTDLDRGAKGKDGDLAGAPKRDTQGTRNSGLTQPAHHLDLILNRRPVLTGEQARKSDATQGEDEVSSRDSSLNHSESQKDEGS